MKAAALGSLALILAITVGCSLTPAQIQNDTALAVTLGLNTVTIFEPQEKPRIKQDVTTLVKTLNETLILQFFPGANAGQLWSSSVDHVITLLGSKLGASPNGAKIIAILSLAKVPIAAALGSTGSPTTPLTPAQQASALGYLSGISQGGASYLGDPSLNPPVPPAATPPVPGTTPPPPAPAPPPPK